MFKLPAHADEVHVMGRTLEFGSKEEFIYIRYFRNVAILALTSRSAKSSSRKKK